MELTSFVTRSTASTPPSSPSSADASPSPLTPGIPSCDPRPGILPSLRRARRRTPARRRSSGECRALPFPLAFFLQIFARVRPAFGSFFNAAKDARHKVKEERDAVVGRKATRDEL